MKGNYIGILIFVKIKNRTDKNYDVSVGLPTYITHRNYQIEARHYLTGYFIAGTIYAGCTVESCFVFDSEQLRRVKVGDKLVLNLSYSDKIHPDKNRSITSYIHVKKRVLNEQFNQRKPKSQCFIATAAYGTPFTQEIEILRYWRDMELKRSNVGNLLVNVYYLISPPIADFIKNKPMLRKLVRIMLTPLVKFLKRRYKQYLGLSFFPIF